MTAIPTVMPIYYPSSTAYLVAYIVTTSLAAVFNILVLSVLWFGVLPEFSKVSKTTQETSKELDVSREHVDETIKTMRRLNALLDAAEARAAATEKKLKEKSKSP